MYLKIKVVANSRRESVSILSEDEVKIETKMPAERNLANERVLEILREMYSGKNIRIISGHHSPSKIVSIN